MTAPAISDSERRALIESVFDSLEEGIVVLDREFNVLLANSRMEQRYAARMPLVGEKCFAVMHDRIRPCLECPYEKSLSTGQPQVQVMRDYCDGDPDGQLGWCEVSSTLIKNSSGTVIGGIEQVKDISEVKSIEETLKDEVTWRRLLVDQSKDGIVVLDHRGKVHEANQQFARMLGYTVEEVQKLHAWDWYETWDKSTLLEQITGVDEQGSHFELRHRRKDGTMLDVEISANGTYYRGEKLVFCVYRDITEKKALQEKIRELAIRDPLTGIYSRRYIFDRLAEVAAEYERGEADFCLSIMDLDRFKSVNDTFGHQAGDIALKEFADLVGSIIRPYDLFGRFGGEEFIIASRDADLAEMAAMMQRMRKKLRNTPVLFEDHEIRLTFSCGLAASTEYPRKAFSLEHMVSLADTRLYEAKAAGRDRSVGPTTTDPGSVQIAAAQSGPSASRSH